MRTADCSAAEVLSNCTSYDSKMAVVNVCTRNMDKAPNSANMCVKINKAPLPSAGPNCGITTRRKQRHELSPRERATSSKLGSTPRKPATKGNYTSGYAQKDRTNNAPATLCNNRPT